MRRRTGERRLDAAGGIKILCHLLGQARFTIGGG
jgi:hypothetical protein